MNTLPQTPDRDLKIRLKKFSLRILKLCDSLPRHGSAQIIGRQLARSGTSPGAQYREACRAKSNADFVSKIEGALQELDEAYTGSSFLPKEPAFQGVGCCRFREKRMS